MTAHRCASLAGLVLSFIACFILLVIAPLAITTHQLHHYQLTATGASIGVKVSNRAF